MPRSTLTGSRIRARRTDIGMKQADLAQACGISPSYLNLIEHNRRRVGGQLLSAMAEALDVDPARLRDGADAGLLGEMRAAASALAVAVEEDRTEEFAGRFPGWADLVRAQARRLSSLERTVETLSDRLAHDPALSASMHEVLSAAASVRSTAGILSDERGDVDPVWRARFLRNLEGDSERLATASRAIADYLDAGDEAVPTPSSPQEELDGWLDRTGFRVEALETDAETPADDILAGAEGLGSGGQALARVYLEQYRADVRALPAGALREAAAAHPRDPSAMAAALGVGLPLLFRRLSTLAQDETGQEIGLAVSDASGTLLFRKPVSGFPLPRFGSGCPIWPLYQVLARPLAPLRRTLELPGRPPRRFDVHGVSEVRVPPGYDMPPVVWSHMLILAAPPGEGGPVLPAGPSCRICPRADCAMRREPSVLAGSL